MTAETLLVGLVASAILIASLRVLVTESDPTIRAWTLGWGAFIASGLLAHVVESNPAEAARLPLFAAYVTSSAAPAFFLWGACALVRYTPPTWLLPAVVTLVTVRAVSGVLGYPVAAEVLSLPIEVGPHAGAAYLIYRWSNDRKLPHDQVALVAAHALMAIAEGTMAGMWIQGWDWQAAKLILSAATVALAGTHIVVVLRLSRDRVVEANESRERDLALLRDLAHLGTRHAAGPPLIEEAADLLGGRLAVDWVGFWRWSVGRECWIASATNDGPQDVDDAIHLLTPRANDLTSPRGDTSRPVLIDIVSGCDVLEESDRVLLPLEWQGEVLGVMGVGRANGQTLAPDVRSVLATLAGELSLSLHHVLSVQQRDRANIELLRERRKMAGVIETTPIGLLVTTAGGQIELMNAAAATHVGCDEPERMLGGPMVAFLDDLFSRIADPEAFVHALSEATDASGYLHDFEVEVLRADDPATLLLFSSQVLDDEGRVTARIWASRDVTSERALGDQLRHAQKLETLGTLSGGIAHDFNNQLAVILGNVRFAKDTLQHESFENEDVDEALGDLERAADHCAQLTRSLLSFARRAPVSLGHVAPNQLVHDLGELLRPLLPASIELRCQADPDLPHLLADSGQLQQVLVNLALNARDAIEGRGEIEIFAQVADLDVEHVRKRGVGRPGRHLAVRVSDSGQGLAPETIERIFEPFYTTKPIGKGTGLGLAIVHGVVTAHGGWIEVESEPGDGTTFLIYLPTDEQTETSTASAARDDNDVIALSTAAAHRERILVADDDAALRKLIKRGLESQGFDVVCVVDGEEAVKCFAEDSLGFAAVVLDWSMPGLTGPEAAERILELEPAVPVLVATGHGAVETEDALEIIPKPFAIDFLATRIRARIEERQQR